MSYRFIKSVVLILSAFSTYSFVCGSTGTKNDDFLLVQRDDTSIVLH